MRRGIPIIHGSKNDLVEEIHYMDVMSNRRTSAYAMEAERVGSNRVAAQCEPLQISISIRLWIISAAQIMPMGCLLGWADTVSALGWR
jgi:hypothetical protein